MTDFHSLSALVTRLEKATSRLEDLAVTGQSGASLQSKRSLAGDVVQAVTSAEVPDSVRKYDEYIDSPLAAFVQISQEIGGVIQEQASNVTELFSAERDLILIATKAKKPDISSTTFANLVVPLQNAMKKVSDLKDQNRGTEYFNHLTCIAEGVPALGWIAVEPAPAPFIKEFNNAAQFYGNRVIKEYKKKDEKHLQWVKSFIALITQLEKYVKEFHTTGLVWNPQGESADVAMAKATAPAASPAPSGGAPPPPPPPPVMTDFSDSSATPKATGSGGADVGALFADINQGSSVTVGLKKVDRSQMTHKNPELRAGGTVGDTPKPKTPPPVNKATKPGAQRVQKPPKTELAGNKWSIENYHDNSNIKIEAEAINQVVYIYNCHNSIIQVSGKVGAITMDSCNKCGLLFESTVASVELVNSKSFAVQVQHVTPTILLDKCDGGQIYLSKESINAEILTAKCSALNILLPDDNEEFQELPVPEQYKTTVKDGKLVTEAMQHTA
ncbi:hypothetical protein BZG36_02332 [Bifiguratus adelaidae]|uniref:Adenylyl cyclase-associated protein n=1 Tax=Bifiguratus adelaidae TaxID=1938954 RepID=A0A261Y2N1_9FUNG|nr:hypothetical protein BZG36_02332 [Bifiguratus adelaidae]